MTAVAGAAVATAERAALGASRVRTRRIQRARRGLGTGVQAAVIALWCLLPVYWMVAASFRQPGEVYSTSLVPASVTLGNYAEAFAPLDLLAPALVHSFGIASLVTLIVLVLGLSGAYALARFRFTGSGFVAGSLLGVSMLPGVVLVTPLFAFFSSLEWSGTFQALLVPYVALGLPFAVYTLATFLRDTPWELEDAALVDGCTRPQAFVRVVLPIVVPSVVTIGLLTFIATWNDYLIASVLSVQGTITVTIVIANFDAQLTGGAATMAVGVIASLPVVLLVLVFQRRITSGLTAGGLRG